MMSCSAAFPAGAQGVTLYRCTDAAGTLTVQNAPCPAGSVQREQQVQGVSSTPAIVPPATSAMPREPAPEPPAALALPDRQTTAGREFVTTSTGPAPRILHSANLPRATPADTATDPERPAPPPLFRCTTYDNDSYLSDEQEVPPRCLPLRTVGLDGNPGAGAGRACEVVRDQCARARHQRQQAGARGARADPLVAGSPRTPWLARS